MRIKMRSLALRINQGLLIPILITVVLFYGKPILVPLCFAILLSMLLAPVCRFLDKKGWPRGLSCTACIFLVILFIALMFFVITMQIAGFVDDFEKITAKADEIWVHLQEWVQKKLDISPEKQDDMIKNQVEAAKKSSGAGAGKIVAGITGLLGGIAIVLVLTFLLLFHKEKYQQFFLKLFATPNKPNVRQTLEEITHVSQQYLTGRMMSMFFIFVLYAIALLIIGIKGALLLAGITALLTIIPYVGSVLGGLIPFMTAAVTEPSIQPAIWVLAAIVIIQAIDNYVIEPNVIGSEVGLSAISTIVAILIGGFLWGVAGMVLFIPLISILKIIFDHVETLKPYGFLLGDEGKSTSSKLFDLFKKKKK